MIIQFNADNNLTVHEEFNNKLTKHITDKLKRFSEQITRIEVHLSDINGSKQGQDDKKCLLEARLENRQPVAVNAIGKTYEVAVDDAVDKLRSMLDTIIGRLQNY
ncbi:MAG: HPF/RaiA family ribosome-associated protein [Chitinophagaceae bacterium]|nr:HPF/RaiA family ribosome-associated protein [Chitinophagaceae bacterium]